jgi:NhaA family Na+:H+ antiporter
VARFGLADVPPDLSCTQIYGASILGGIGFTIALFVSDLAIQDSQPLGFSKLAILWLPPFAPQVVKQFFAEALPPDSL